MTPSIATSDVTIASSDQTFSWLKDSVNGNGAHKAEKMSHVNKQMQNGMKTFQPISEIESLPEGVENVLQRYPETGINVLIVGAGQGGLSAALECWRKGHTVRVIERQDGPIDTGDSLCIQPSAYQILRHWPDLAKHIDSECYDTWISYKRHTGQHILGPDPPCFNDPEELVGRKGPHVPFEHGRVKLHYALLAQMKRLGIKVEYSKKVVDYVEDEERGVGGAVLANGEVLEADVVVAADGLKTSSTRIVAHEEVNSKDTGIAIYRAAYHTDHALSDPLVRERWGFKKGDRPIWEFWLGGGIHVLINITDDLVTWGMTHADTLSTSSESWTPNCSPAEVAKTVQEQCSGWDPAIFAFMNTAPKGSIVHWKLNWRDLRERWASPGARVVQLGDSAHSFLPTSGNGASQAWEDSITLATCLQLAGTAAGAPNAVRVYNKLRYQRVSCAQKMAFVNGQTKHQPDWDKIMANPSMVRSRFPRWVYAHDPEDYAYKNFGLSLQHILSGGKIPFENYNYPKGHKFKSWTIDDVQKDMAEGKTLADLLDGDWA